MATGTLLINLPHALRWNTHKRFLLDLARRGVPTIPAIWVGKGASPDLVRVLQAGRGLSLSLCLPEAEFQLEVFAEKWDKHSPAMSKSWRAHWTRIIPSFSFPEEIRRVIYTTNAMTYSVY